MMKDAHHTGNLTPTGIYLNESGMSLTAQYNYIPVYAQTHSINIQM